MENNKIGCRAGRTKIVDPNKFDGQSSSSNIPVQLEDLNISVILKTFKKGRTVLSAGPKGNSIDSSNDLEVNFIEGSNIGGKKVLTTNYTDLTTIFDGQSENNDVLGITNIDIDFNSQLAPMVNINFIDVRGSSIFQNEDKITGGKNKYATFFQLPYPLFELTIKGYYGRPVKYCLHLTKFNSKFNSKTGNFEISCNFIGYTYAMLSDMLIGYLKAIPYTKIGAERYKEINNARAKINPPLLPILNLNELMIKISTINQAIDKISAENPDSGQMGIIDANKELLLSIENELKLFGDELDSRTNKESISVYDYIVNPVNTKETEKIVAKFKEKVLPFVESFKKNNLVDLDLEAFKLPNFWVSKTKEELSTSAVLRDVNFLAYMNSPSNNLTDILPKTHIDAWDLTDIYISIAKAKTSLDINYDIAKKSLAGTIKDNIKVLLDFDPTVRNIIEIFTTAVEVYMETIYTISLAAETDTNGLRKKQLTPKFSDPKKTDEKDNALHPWPDYRESNGKNGDESYTEKYLGAPGVLQIPKDVQELEFIDDLLLAFIKAQNDVQTALSNITNTESNWFPINPVDTRLFGIDKSPYTRIEGINRNEVIKLMIIRGMTFLGYTNSNLTKEEIEGMAENEFNSVITNLADDGLGTIKSSLRNLTLSDFTDAKSDIIIDDKTFSNVNLISSVNNGKQYKYSYISLDETKGRTVLPIDNSFSSNWPLSSITKMEFKSDYSKFLTNYNPKYKNEQLNDGGIYLKILSNTEYTTSLPLPTTTIDTTIKPLILEKLKDVIDSKDKAKATGFNVFSGKFGIQEFETLDYGIPDLKNLPLMYVFYHDGNIIKSKITLNKIGLGKAREDKDSTPYDFKIGANDFIDDEHINKVINNDYKTHDDYKHNRLNFNNIISGKKNIEYPYINQTIKMDSRLYSDKEHTFSLFGSRFYYGQDQGSTITPNANKAKALLFLNTLPFNGAPFEAQEIQNLFKIRGGFIHTPKLWCAYVGGLLWRRNNIVNNKHVDVIKWFDVNNTPLLEVSTTTGFKFIPPKTDENINQLFFADKTPKYKGLSDQLINMPNQAKEEFIRIFEDFVNIDWNNIKNNCEIIKDGTMVSFDKMITKLHGNNKTSYLGSEITNEPLMTNQNNYIIITPVKEHYELFLEFNTKISGNPSKNIIKLLMDEVIIVNSNYKSWINNEDNILSNTDEYMDITVNNDYFNLYFNKLIELFKPEVVSQIAQKKEKEQTLFGTTNEEIIKLRLYNVCKNIYDKWLGGASDINNVIFQCGKSVKNNNDSKLANHYRPGDKARLIDSFRFVDRAFGDIGDKLFINPTPVNDYLMNSPNTSFYDAIGHLLSSNNFNFIALPTYINYNDDKELNDMFKPFGNYEEAIEDGICGPTFVCVYIGQTSKHLDFRDSHYSNDGVDFQCSENGNIIDIPLDFSSTGNTYDNDVAVFSVNYSQQNQNIFKDITLDQSEFTETDESLQVTDDIASKGAENNVTLAGQNIYNVYSVRSYKAEVEMMGNAMIQPMMHFQLNNIPMFHGGYLITRVKHSIIPNNMSTSFTGVRIRYPKTKLLDGVDFYMNLIDSINLAHSSGGVSAGGGKTGVAPIVKIIKDNGGTNGNFVKGNITATSISSGKGWVGIKTIASTLKPNEILILTEAVKPLEAMLTDWVAWMISKGFKGQGGKYASITSAYRNYETQEEIRNSHPNSSAVPGTSMHGWGIAIDFNFYNKDGKLINNYINNKPNLEEGFNFDKNPALIWLLEHSYEYGWIIPEGLRNDYGVEEFWHFEYHGKSAACILKQRPTIKGKLIDTNNTIKPIVLNPKTPAGVESDLSNCNYIYVGNGDGVSLSSHLSKGEFAQNQLDVKNILKSKGLTKIQAAGIMGNIQQESGFNPSAGAMDTNHAMSIGLFGFNAKSYSLSDIGNTVENQLTFLFNTPKYKTWKNNTEINSADLSVERSTFLFAKWFEGCANCQEFNSFSVSDGGKKRIGYAIDTHNRFNNVNDKLAW